MALIELAEEQRMKLAFMALLHRFGRVDEDEEGKPVLILKGEIDPQLRLLSLEVSPSMACSHVGFFITLSTFVRSLLRPDQDSPRMYQEMKQEKFRKGGKDFWKDPEPTGERREMTVCEAWDWSPRAAEEQQDLTWEDKFDGEKDITLKSITFWEPMAIAEKTEEEMEKEFAFIDRAPTDPDRVHYLGDGRGERDVFVDGKLIERCVYVDEVQGIAERTKDVFPFFELVRGKVEVFFSSPEVEE